MTRLATIAARGAHRQWKCPCCGRTLGEVFTDRVVVKAGDRMISFPVDAPVVQTCPKCATESIMVAQENAA